MEIDFLNGNNTFKLQMTLNRHNARPRLNYYGLPYPPHFSLPSTFNASSFSINSLFTNLILTNLLKGTMPWVILLQIFYESYSPKALSAITIFFKWCEDIHNWNCIVGVFTQTANWQLMSLTRVKNWPPVSMTSMITSFSDMHWSRLLRQ